MQPYHTLVATRQNTPQSEPLPGQSPNNAGGHAWKVDHWTQLDRFLILGSIGGTYYVGERELTKQNTSAIDTALAEDGLRVVARVVEISEGGRAPKNDPALLVLAKAASSGDQATRQAALEALPRVARIPTHLFHFVQYALAFRRWGRGLRRAVARWYHSHDDLKLARQMTKYQARDGWSHTDLIRLAHVKPISEAQQVLFLRAGVGPKEAA